MALSKDQILSADDIRTQTVPVPEWNGDVIVRALSGTERDSYESSMFKQVGQKTIRDTRNIRSRLVVRALVDENGKRIFNDDDAPKLGAKSAEVLDRLFDVVRELSGMDDEDEEGNDKAVGEAAENLGDTPVGDSTSDSPESSDAQSLNS